MVCFEKFGKCANSAAIQPRFRTTALTTLRRFASGQSGNASRRLNSATRRHTGRIRKIPRATPAATQRDSPARQGTKKFEEQPRGHKFHSFAHAAPLCATAGAARQRGAFNPGHDVKFSGCWGAC